MQESNKSNNLKKSSNFVAIKDLPLYAKENTNIIFENVKDKPIFLEKQCRIVREKLCHKYNDFAAKFQPIKNFFLFTQETVNNGKKYFLSEEAAALPKATAIALGGMAGVIISLRRYGILRKVIYPATGVITITAFCYPNESIDIAQIGIAHAQRSWDDLRKTFTE